MKELRTHQSALQWTAGTLFAVASVGIASAQAPAPPPPPPEEGWKTSAAAGVTLTRGNSENFLATFGLDANRKWTRDEILFGASAGYGKTTVKSDTEPDEETTTDAFVKGSGSYNHLFTERFYGGLRLDALHDDVSDVKYRFTFAPVVGYYFIKEKKVTLSGDIGPAWVHEKVGDHNARGYLGLRAGERFEYKFDGGARIWQSADITPEVQDWENYVFNFEVGVDAPLTKALSARLVASNTYDSQPDEGREKNDFKLTAGIAYKF